MRSRRAPRAVLLGVAATLASIACAPREQRDLARASDGLAREIRRSDHRAVLEAMAPGSRPQVDLARLTGSPEVRGPWARALAKPVALRPEALIFVAPDRPVRARRGEEGWLFAEDPFLRWDQSTPRAALRSLVRASREKRWDVLVNLAPERYRLGLSTDDLRAAWTEGAYAEALQKSRDRLARHLADPIRADAHEAALDLGEGHVARLEREGERWVVVDF